MSLINEIIELLSSKDGSLTEALLKTKVLMHRIGHKELAEWVNFELNGYANEEQIPKYRRLSAQVLANASNAVYQVSSHPIPLSHLKREQREILEIVKMNQSLAVLEKFSIADGNSLMSPIPMEYNGLLGKKLSNGYVIERAWSQITVEDVTQILIQVRSRLLDFILGLQDEIGLDATDSDIQSRAGSLDAPGMFRNAIFGDNTTIVVGSNNNSSITNIQVVGDFTALASALRASGVSEPDVISLKSAIDLDATSEDVQQKKYGPRVKEWLRNMLGKAVDASWNVELGIASSLLATAIQKFYGWP